MQAPGQGTSMRTSSAIDLYGSALQANARGQLASCRATASDGTWRRLPLERWLRPPGPEEAELLGHLVAPVLDVGCGAGRHLVELKRAGLEALGVDIAPAAIALARRRGVSVLQRSIFDSLPGCGAWASALLLDGNIGIGGDPGALLRRLRTLLGPEGSAFVELEAPGWASRSVQVRLETATTTSEWIPWAWMSVDDIEAVAERAGFSLHGAWERGGRWFARLACRPRLPRPGSAPLGLGQAGAVIGVS